MSAAAHRSLLDRLRDRWRQAPLALTFTCYLATCLVLATIVAAEAIDAASLLFERTLTVRLNDGSLIAGDLYSGPYLYDATADELVPAYDLHPPGDDTAAFIALSTSSELARERERNGLAPLVYATLGSVETGEVRLYDWGLNYTEAATMDEILDEGGPISAGELAAYDARQRELRQNIIPALGDGSIAQLASNVLVSNVGYYAHVTEPSGPLYRMGHALYGMLPLLVYAVFIWVFFRRFYRVHIARPLGELGRAAERIAAQDLDGRVPEVRGRELGRLGHTMEEMRAALLNAQRELWRTAEERRRLNAAFAHDLRTPITVLKGTLEMARMRAAREGAIAPGRLEALSGQVERLESYATAMGGLSKLEERTVVRKEMRTADVLGAIRACAEGFVSARRGSMRLDVALSESDEDAIALDMPLVEEVLGNLLSNACGHARERIEVTASVDEGTLLLRVADDGAGFTPEALRHGCDPFFSERKSAEHFGLGLNIATTLAHLHGGKLELANAEEGGAVVAVTFR